MSRSKIVLLLYVMTFLMSAYVKFTAPHRLDPNYEIVRDNEAIYIGNERVNTVNYQWSAPQVKASFNYSIAKQLGGTIICDNTFLPNGPGLYRLTYRDSMNSWIAQFVESRANKNYLLEFEIEEDPSGYYSLEINKQGNKWKEKLIPLSEQNYTITYTEKDFNDIMIFRKIPFKNGDIIINYHKIGKDLSNRGNLLFCSDFTTISLFDSTWTSSRMVFEDSCSVIQSDKNPFFGIKFDLPSNAHQLRGTYLDFIEETVKTSGKDRLLYAPEQLRIMEGDLPDKFVITYPPESFQEETPIPVGVPHKQTVIATLPIQSINLQIGDKFYPAENQYYQVDFLKDDSLVQIGDLSFKPHSNKRIFDIIFPVTEGVSNKNVFVTLKAKSGSEDAERSWPVNVMGLKFASWPPLKPKKWARQEEDLFNTFLKRFPNQESYTAASAEERQRYPLLFESREITVAPHFQNVDFGTYKNYRITYPEAPGNNVTRSGANMQREIEQLPRDINQVILTVETNYGSKGFGFYVKKVGTTGDPTLIARCDVRLSGGSGIFTIFVDCLDYFEEKVLITDSSIRFQPSLPWRKVGENLIEVEGNINNVRMSFDIPLTYSEKAKNWQQQLEAR